MLCFSADACDLVLSGLLQINPGPVRDRERQFGGLAKHETLGFLFYLAGLCYVCLLDPGGGMDMEGDEGGEKSGTPLAQ